MSLLHVKCLLSLNFYHFACLVLNCPVIPLLGWIPAKCCHLSEVLFGPYAQTLCPHDIVALSPYLFLYLSPLLSCTHFQEMILAHFVCPVLLPGNLSVHLFVKWLIQLDKADIPCSHRSQILNKGKGETPPTPNTYTPKYIWQCVETIFVVITKVGVTTVIWWTEARNAIKQSTTQRTVCHNTELSGSNVNSAETEKLS